MLRSWLAVASHVVSATGSNADRCSRIRQKRNSCECGDPGLIDTQIARDVVAENEQAYREIETHVPIGRAGRPEEIAAAVLGSAVTEQATSWDTD